MSRGQRGAHTIGIRQSGMAASGAAILLLVLTTGAFAEGKLERVVCGLATDTQVSSITPTSEFSSATPAIYCEVEVVKEEAGGTLESRWIAEDVGSAAPANTLIGKYSITLPEGSVGPAHFSVSRPDKGWPGGSYRFELWLAEERIGKVPFTIVDTRFDDGLRAAETGDYKKAIALWLPIAQMGHPLAAHNLGILHLQGWGVEQDPATAAQFFTLAAQQGHPPALTELSKLFLKGEGVEQDLGKAYGHVLIAVRLGDPSAEEGQLYMEKNLPPEALEAGRALADEIIPSE